MKSASTVPLDNVVVTRVPKLWNPVVNNPQVKLDEVGDDAIDIQKKNRLLGHVVPPRLLYLRTFVYKSLDETFKNIQDTGQPIRRWNQRTYSLGSVSALELVHPSAPVDAVHRTDVLDARELGLGKVGPKPHVLVTRVAVELCL